MPPTSSIHLVTPPIIQVNDAAPAVILNLNAIHFGTTTIVKLHAVAPTLEAAAIIAAVFDRIEQLLPSVKATPALRAG